VRATLGELPDNVEIVEWDMSGPAPLARADMVIPPYLQSLEVLKSLEGLDVGLVQSLTARLRRRREFLPRHMTFANAARYMRRRPPS